MTVALHDGFLLESNLVSIRISCLSHVSHRSTSQKTETYVIVFAGLCLERVGEGMPGAFAFFNSRWFCWLDFKGTTCVVKPTVASGPCITQSFFFCLLSYPQAGNGQSAAPDGGAHHHCAWVSVLVDSGGSYPSRTCPSQGRHKTTESKQYSQRRAGPMTTCSHHHIFVPAEGIFFCQYYLFDCVLWWFFKRWDLNSPLRFIKN